MRKTILGIMALLMFGMVGLTSCEKEKTPSTPVSTPSSDLVGTWKAPLLDNEGYCELTFQTDGYCLFELYDNDNELVERESFSYTYYSEDGTLLIPYYSEFNSLLGDVIDAHIGDGGFDQESFSALSVIAFTSEGFTLIDHKANSGKSLSFKRIK